MNSTFNQRLTADTPATAGTLFATDWAGRGERQETSKYNLLSKIIKPDELAEICLLGAQKCFHYRLFFVRVWDGTQEQHKE